MSPPPGTRKSAVAGPAVRFPQGESAQYGSSPKLGLLVRNGQSNHSSESRPGDASLSTLDGISTKVDKFLRVFGNHFEDLSPSCRVVAGFTIPRLDSLRNRGGFSPYLMRDEGVRNVDHRPPAVNPADRRDHVRATASRHDGFPGQLCGPGGCVGVGVGDRFSDRGDTVSRCRYPWVGRCGRRYLGLGGLAEQCRGFHRRGPHRSWRALPQ